MAPKRTGSIGWRGKDSKTGLDRWELRVNVAIKSYDPAQTTRYKQVSRTVHGSRQEAAAALEKFVSETPAVEYCGQAPPVSREPLAAVRRRNKGIPASAPRARSGHSRDHASLHAIAKSLNDPFLSATLLKTMEVGLLLHFGAYHGWQGRNAGNFLLAEMFARHDADHHRVDTIGFYDWLPVSDRKLTVAFYEKAVSG